MGAVPNKQVVARPFGLSISRPVGSVSVKATPVSWMAFGLATEKVNVLYCELVAIETGEKALERVGYSGRRHQSISLLSLVILDEALLPLVTAVIRNQVFDTPVVAAVAVAKGCQEPLVADTEPAFTKFVPSVLE